MRDNEKMTVKEGFEKEYETYVGKNQDGYGNACIVAGALIGKGLDDGLSPELAEKEMFKKDNELGGLTGFMMGCVASALARFHPRGDEYRKYFNGVFGVSEKQAKGGVVNPAILTIKT